MQNALTVIRVFIASLPTGVRAIGILAGGALGAYVLKIALSWFLQLVRFDRLSAALGVTEFLRKGRVRQQPSRLLGSLAWWVVLLITLLQIARLLDIKVVNSFSDRLAAIVPGLLAGLFVGTVGLVLVSFLGNFIMTIAQNAATPHAALLSRGVKIAGTILVLGLALAQVDLSGTMISALFQILFAAIVFALALAFGLGCKELARDAVAKIIQNLREKTRTDGRADLEG